MAFCPGCGTDLEAPFAAAAATEVGSDEVRIAKINADRDVEVARINASLQRSELETAETIAEVEAEAQVATAEAEAEVIAAVISETGGQGDEPDDPPPAPVIVDNDPPPDEPDAPPLAEPSEPEPHAKRSVGLGVW